MRVLVIYDPQNTFIRTILPNASGWLKKDGKEFKAQAGKCIDFYRDKGFNIWWHRIEGKNAFEKRQNLFRSLEDFANRGIKFDRIINLTHGAKYNLNRKMISIANIEKFAEKLKAIASDQCKIVLFSCWTGFDIDNGFARKLSDITMLDVISHSTRGHTTRNPNKVQYVGDSHRSYNLAVKTFGISNPINKMKNSLNQSPTAPFEFVEEVFNGK